MEFILNHDLSRGNSGQPANRSRSNDKITPKISEALSAVQAPQQPQPQVQPQLQYHSYPPPQPPMEQHVAPRPAHISFASSAPGFAPVNVPEDSSWESAHAQLRSGMDTNLQRSRTSYMY
eukprot:TRINITY_DN951_c0_g2_i2.p1 TRINITY_DN951_c0_g2~~TRINITY_DN951_c0_g2_i2.p1  ORF type:complete len:120 (+),score=7.49 TRINITY_DN951_c0_g2_i2:34-393(+)